MRLSFRLITTLTAIGAIVYGFITQDQRSDTEWLAALGIAGALLIVAWWPARIRSLPPFNRSVLKVATILLVAFTLITVQLVRIQLVESSRTIERSVVTERGDVIQDPRQREANETDNRGSILDRNGVVLAEQAENESGQVVRVYPEASTTGLTGYYSPLLFGDSQIEAAYAEQLTGREGGNPVSEWLDEVLNRERDGYDVQLTIDVELQRLANELLGERAGAVVLMDAESGEVLAMHGAPGYDPNRLYADSDSPPEQINAARAYWEELATREDSPLLFRPTMGLYVPGSIFKMVTASAVIDAGISDPDTMYRDEGVLEVDGRVIIELNRPDENRADWTLEESFAYSLNVVFARIGLELEADLLSEYAERFGFGQEIPFDLPVNESLLTTGEGGLDSRTLVADTAFGQGELLVTPLQMALITSTIANDGEMMEPRLVDRVLDPGGDVLEESDPDRWKQPISEESAAAMQQLMEASADYGYASGAQIEGLTVGGKTGTAETGEGEESHAWFTGYASDDERTLAVAVIVERGGRGGEVALPIGRDLLAAAFAGD